MPTLLPPDLIEQFDLDGFVVVPNLLTEEEVLHFQPLVSDAVKQRKRFDRRPLAERTAYEQSFLQCMNLWEDFEAIRPLTFHPLVAQAAAELIGASAVRLLHDQALFKEAGGRETDLHQDLPYWPIKESDTVSAWIPFDGSTRASGCMGYVPGSHKLGVRKLVNIFSGASAELAAQAEDLRTTEPRYVEVPRGAVAFHHGLTAHGALPNRTDRTREVHTMIFFRDGCTRNKARHDMVDRVGIEVGAPIDSPLTPIAWPRTGLPPSPPRPGELPRGYRLSGVFPFNDNP